MNSLFQVLLKAVSLVIIVTAGYWNHYDFNVLCKVVPRIQAYHMLKREATNNQDVYVQYIHRFAVLIIVVKSRIDRVSLSRRMVSSWTVFFVCFFITYLM